MGSRWCTECRSMVPVAETFTASVMRAWGEMEYHVTALECGHEIQGPESKVAEAPGAPFAGPQVAVARSTRLRDLQAASRRQGELDRGGLDDY